MSVTSAVASTPTTAAALFAPYDLDGLLAPPAKKARRTTPFASLPGVKPEILADYDLMRRWRHDIHMNPELGFEEHRTSDLVAKLLAKWGIEVSKGKFGGPTGVIGTLRGATASERCIGLRADLDGLPMQEVSDSEYKSANVGAHHGCGHDGHTSMLLGAAKYLAETRRFSGTVHFFFQPNEEATGEFQGPRVEHALGQSGGELMVRQGVFDEFPVDQVYGMHNWPALEAGTVGVRAGALMGSEDNFIVTVKGQGGHGAMPHLCVDPLLIGVGIKDRIQILNFGLIFC